MRGFAEQDGDGEWDMLIEARPLDIDHRVDDDTVASLFQEIVADPPELPGESLPYDVIDATDMVSVETAGEDIESADDDDQ